MSSRSRGRRDKLCLGLINPHSRRTVLILLAVGTVLCSFWLQSSRAAAIEYPASKASAAIGRQAFQAAFHSQPRVSVSDTAEDQSNAPVDWPDDDEDDDYWLYGDEEPTEWDWGYQDKVNWDPTRLDSTPITEIAIKSCVVSPLLYDVCSPPSSKKEDATHGPWIRIDRDLNKRVGVYYLYVFVRRLVPGSKAPVVTNITLLTSKPESGDLTGTGTWVEVSESIRKGVWPSMPAMFLHYRLTDQDDIKAARGASGYAGGLEPITGIDVLYGNDDVQPLPGFAKVKPMITGGEDDTKRVQPKSKGSRPGVSLAVRKQLPKTVPRPELRFNRQGSYKILQVADLHFSVALGDCRDVGPDVKEECLAKGGDRYTLDWLERSLDTVQPDLVVLTGDQLNGQDTSWAGHSVILKWAPLIYSRKIPWTIIFGNHDSDDGLSNADQMAFYTKLPYFMGSAGPDGVDGVGNYVLPINSYDSTNTTLFNLYFLDSHSSLKSLNPFQKPSYDYIHPNQLNWIRMESSHVKAINRPYRPAQDFVEPGRTSTETPKTSTTVKEDEDDAIPEGEEDGDAADDEEDERNEIADPKMRKIVKRQGAQLDAAEEEQKEKLDDTLSPQVIADDTQIRPDDPAPPTFENDDGSPLDAFGEEAIEPVSQDPTVLPGGPSFANPMRAKPNAMAFFHIPLPESYDAPIDVRQSRKPFLFGERKEGYGASKTNGQFFELAIESMGELVESSAQGSNDDRLDEFFDGEFTNPTSGRPEIKVVANGHCHISADCRRVKGTWLCFGGGASYAGYGAPDFERRMRVFEISDYGETIETYHLFAKRGQGSKTVLVGKGAME